MQWFCYQSKFQKKFEGRLILGYESDTIDRNGSRRFVAPAQLNALHVTFIRSTDYAIYPHLTWLSPWGWLCLRRSAALKSNYALWVVVCACVVFSLGIAYFRSGSPQIRDAKVAAQKDSLASKAKEIVGGVERAVGEAERLNRVSTVRVGSVKKIQGYSPAVDPSLNTQTKSVFEALQSKTSPERYSSFVIKETFDKDQFQSRGREYSEEYAKIVEPGRVYTSAQPGEGVVAIHSVGKRFHRVTQGETVVLKVRATPSSPVTFTSPRLGTFDSGLSSITVVATEDGEASASFTATGGTIDEVQVLAASPVNSGQAKFTISVSPKK